MKANLYVPSFFTGSSHPNFYRVLNFIGISITENPKRSCLLLTILFHLLLVAEPVQAQVTNKTVKSGNFNDATVWSMGVAPDNSNKHNIEINHDVSFNVSEFWLGGQNQGVERQMVINTSGSLNGTGKLIIPNNKSKLINHGSLKLSNSFTFGYNYQDSAYFENTGEATITGMQELGKGSILNKGKLIIAPTAVLKNITFKTATNSSTTFRSTIDINVGSTIINNGSFAISSTSDDALKINNGKFWNYGNVEITGRLNLASGSPDNPVKNRGIFKAGRVYLNNRSSIENWGKFYITRDLYNGQGVIINHPCAYIEQSTPQSTENLEAAYFINRNNGAILTNNGYILINGNFTNIAQALFNGSGTTHIKGLSVNSDQARIEGSHCIFDPTASASTLLDLPYRNNATIASTVKRCASSVAPNCSVCEKPTLSLAVKIDTQPTQPSRENELTICNFETGTLTVGTVQANTTYTYASDGFIIEETSPGTATITALVLVDENTDLGVRTITVTATNDCGSTTAHISLNVVDCGTNNPLPVELTSFNGAFANNAVKLTWSTASEKNNDYFTIERSTNGHEFTQIGQVKGNGNSQVALTYTFLDQQPVAGTTYYRLKQVDFDGAYEYSKMITVKAAPSSQKIQRVNVTAVYPNPVIPGKPVVLDVELASAGEVNLVLLDKTGRTLQSRSVQGQAGKQKIELDLLQQSPAGIYFLKVYQGKEVTMHKLVKNN
ncbi:T9SS type A sorting domain-containing protein [Rufibacter immobilis]|uniref:T9SS type A sorting domain-containing protein n=1 Tax=Rufibacter immobilis TaxID=1348778 RepID=UPI0035EDA131